MSGIILQPPARFTVLAYLREPNCIRARITLRDVPETWAVLSSNGSLEAGTDLSTAERWGIKSAMIDEMRRRTREARR